MADITLLISLTASYTLLSFLFHSESRELMSPKQPSRKDSSKKYILAPAIVEIKQEMETTRKGCFSEDEAKPLVRQLLSALQKMHSLGIVHRDLNPNNIFLHFPRLPHYATPPPNHAEGSFSWVMNQDRSASKRDRASELQDECQS